jgi:hypothetical protein
MIAVGSGGPSSPAAADPYRADGVGGGSGGAVTGAPAGLADRSDAEAADACRDGKTSARGNDGLVVMYRAGAGADGIHPSSARRPSGLVTRAVG